MLLNNIELLERMRSLALCNAISMCIAKCSWLSIYSIYSGLKPDSPPSVRNIKHENVHAHKQPFTIFIYLIYCSATGHLVKTSYITYNINILILIHIIFIIYT